MTVGKVNGVPPFAIGLMAVIGIVMVVIPIMTYWVLKPKYKLRASPVWVGAAIFFVAVIILEPILHAIVLRPTANGSIGLVVHHPWVYVAYGALAAGIFEETGRFIGFRYLKKRVSGFQTAIAYGIGHGGIEMILVGAMGMVNSIMFSTAINSHSTAIMAKIPSTTMHSLMTNAAGMAILALVERIGAFLIQILLSMIVWAAVNYVGKWWLYPVAIVLHAVVDTPSAMFQAGLISSQSLVEVLLWVTVILLAIFVYYVIGGLVKRQPTSTIGTK